MADAQIEKIIDDAWEGRAGISSATQGAVREAVETALERLDSGKAHERMDRMVAASQGR